MELTANNLEKTSIIKQETIVSKLHNMHWLKNTSYSPNSKKTKDIHEQRRNSNKNNKATNKVLLIRDTKANSVTDSNKYHLTIDTCIKDSFTDTISESNKNIFNIDVDMFSNPCELTIQKVEEEEILSMAVMESIVTAKLEAQCRIDEEHEKQTIVSQNDAEDKIQDVACSNILNSQEIYQDTKELILTKHSDDNNNDSKLAVVCKLNAQKTTDDAENSKVSIEVEDKGICIKEETNIPKINIKTDGNTILSKNKEKSFTIINSKKSINNLSKPSSPIDKHEKVDQFNNKYVSMRKDAYRKEKESIKQHSIIKNRVESKSRDNTAKSCLLKTDPKTEINKTTMENKNDQKTQSLSRNTSINNDKTTLQKQKQIIPTQFVSKFKESFKKTTSTLNGTADKNKILEKTEKNIYKCKNSDLSESVKKDEKIIDEKDFQNDQKISHDINVKKSTMFSTHNYRNSTFSKFAQTRNMSGNSEHTLPHHRNSSFTRNNSIHDRKCIDNNRHKDVMKIKREYTSSNAFSKSNMRTEERTNNLENNSKEKNKINDIRLPNSKLTNVHKTDTATVNKKSSIDSVKTETHLDIENKESVNLSIDHAKERYENGKADNSKAELDEQYIKMNNEKDNEEINSSKYSSNIWPDNCTVGSQSISMNNQHSLKLQDIQQADNVNKLENNQIPWDNDLFNNHAYSFDNAMQENATIGSTQRFIQNMHMQETITQAGNQIKQMDHGRFYDQHSLFNDAMQLSQIPNTFNTYAYNGQVTSSDNDITTSVLKAIKDDNGENSSVLHRYAPNIQQRSISDFHPTSNQTNRWSPLMQDIFPIEQFVNTTQPTIHVYNSETFDSDNFNNTHITNCLPSHQVLYTSSPYMQTWNPQLQCPMPVYHDSLCTNYTMFPNMTNQSNNFSDIATDSMSMRTHDRQHISYAQMNNNFTDTGPIQMHTDPNYVNNMHVYGNNIIDTRNAINNIPMKPNSNRYYKKYSDNCQVFSNIPRYAAPISHPRPRRPFIPAMNRYNMYHASNQKYRKQNTVNYMQIPKSPKGQKIQNFICEDNDLEHVPPLISPKEFITNNVSPSNESEQLATSAFKSDFKMKPNIRYHQQPLQRYNGSFSKNIVCKDFSEEYKVSISVGRGISKNKKRIEN